MCTLTFCVAGVTQGPGPCLDKQLSFFFIVRGVESSECVRKKEEKSINDQKYGFGIGWRFSDSFDFGKSETRRHCKYFMCQ
jgi:hypothetical protein